MFSLHPSFVCESAPNKQESLKHGSKTKRKRCCCSIICANTPWCWLQHHNAQPWGCGWGWGGYSWLFPQQLCFVHFILCCLCCLSLFYSQSTAHLLSPLLHHSFAPLSFCTVFLLLFLTQLLSSQSWCFRVPCPVRKQSLTLW